MTGGLCPRGALAARVVDAFEDPRHIPIVPTSLEHPFDLAAIMRRRKALRKELSSHPGLLEVRIALLGGSTTSELRDFLELFALASGMRPAFYECEYAKYEEEVLLDDTALRAFNPQIAVVHTTWVNARFPEPFSDEVSVSQARATENARFSAIWEKLIVELGCSVIQNNFDEPAHRSLGGLDASVIYGRAAFLRQLNADFAAAARQRPRLLINDIAHLAAVVGLDVWYDPSYWFNYKLAVAPAATVALAHNIAAIVRGLFGKTRKVLVLDLDNTLWGGVIGDDGVEGLRLGKETPEGEAYTAFQQYCLALKQRGVLLAVCSKNEPLVAREGFSHPDSILKLSDFAAFKASWDPKHEAIAEIAHELNLGLESFVFVDDNPAEREIVSAQLPMVAVPNMSNDPSRYIDLLDRQLYFEPVGISAEDLQRSGFYASNVQRNLQQATFSDYGAFLDSLAMKAEIAPFGPTYLDRIVQLTNKTNQFNLTTRRYTAGEMDAVCADPQAITLYARLSDKFGENGIVSLAIARLDREKAVIELWLMSCRVLKRELELLVLDELAARAAARGATTLVGYYRPTAKNRMVSDHYAKLGFDLIAEHSDGSSDWQLPLNAHYAPRCIHIKEVIRG